MPSQANQKEWEWDPSKSIWVQKCMPDPAMDLNPRVLQSMLRIEEAHAPVNYFTKEHQNDIRPWMRRMVTTWMLEVISIIIKSVTLKPTSQTCVRLPGYLWLGK